MAISKELWDKAKFLFELNKSLNEIEAETGINRTTIGKKANKEGWIKGKNLQLKTDIVEYETEKSTLDNKKSTLVEKVSQLSDFEITLFDGIVENEVKHKSIIFSTQTLALIRNNQILTKNTKTVMLKVAQYNNDGQRSGEQYEPYEVELSPSDIKEVIDSTDKAAITLKVADRHAPKQDINLTNAQQNNEPVKIIFERLEKKDNKGTL